MQVHVPTTLKQMVDSPSVFGKLVLLATIKNHPLHPYVFDMIEKTMDIAMKKNLPNQDMIDHIDVCLEMMIERFEQNKQTT